MKTDTTTETAAQGRNVRRKVVFDYDLDPDLSWLDPEDEANHIALSMLVYEMNDSDDDWKLVDSLGNIDCLKSETDWDTGTFYNLASLPEGYLRDLAKEAGIQ